MTNLAICRETPLFHRAASSQYHVHRYRLLFRQLMRMFVDFLLSGPPLQMRARSTRALVFGTAHPRRSPPPAARRHRMVERDEGSPRLDDWSRGEWTPPQEEEIRVHLAKLPPFQVLSLVYGRGSKAGESDVYRDLRDSFPSRTALFEWLYQSRSLAEALSYVRFPSQSKRKFVRALLSLSRDRDPWLTSRNLHSIAFSPSCYSRARSKMLQPRSLRGRKCA